MPFIPDRKLFCAFVLAVSIFGASPAPARELASDVTELDHMPPLPGNFPVPNDPNMLFYLQRSTNANTIVYAANMDAQGHIDPDTPIDAYWRRYAEEGQRRGLHFLERLVAFGVHARPIAGHANTFNADIAGYPERSFSVEIDKTGSPEAVTKMGARNARLVAAYLQLDEHGLIPSLVYCDIYGVDQATGQLLKEHLVPKTG
jgi:hypothetical protein